MIVSSKSNLWWLNVLGFSPLSPFCCCSCPRASHFTLEHFTPPFPLSSQSPCACPGFQYSHYLSSLHWIHPDHMISPAPLVLCCCCRYVLDVVVLRVSSFHVRSLHVMLSNLRFAFNFQIWTLKSSFYVDVQVCDSKLTHPVYDLFVSCCRFSGYPVYWNFNMHISCSQKALPKSCG